MYNGWCNLHFISYLNSRRGARGCVRGGGVHEARCTFSYNAGTGPSDLVTSQLYPIHLASGMACGTPCAWWWDPFAFSADYWDPNLDHAMCQSHSIFDCNDKVKKQIKRYSSKVFLFCFLGTKVFFFLVWRAIRFSRHFPYKSNIRLLW